MKAYISSVKPASFNKYGAVCWANVILHSLLSIGSITENMLDSSFNQTSMAIMRAIEGDQNSLDALARSLTDNIFDQQCAHEAYIGILDKIGLDKYFDIDSERTIYCKVCCKNTSCVRSKSNYIMCKGFKNVRELFMQDEPNVEYKCDICKSSQTTVAQVIARRVENVITVVIDQFTQKILPNIMYEFIIKTPQGTIMQYKLCAIIEHYGSLAGGHYVGYFKRANQWYFTNDTEIKAVDQPKPSSATYMLFFEFTK